MKRTDPRLLSVGVLVAGLAVVVGRLPGQNGLRAQAPQRQPAPIIIDYPVEGSVFPPDISAPTFLWRDAGETARVWRIDVAFGDGSAGIQVKSPGERMRVGEIDLLCAKAGAETPRLTPQQAAAHVWKPDAKTWATIKTRSVERPATIAWRLRNVSEPKSRIVMQGLPTCGNCHSFSRDGKTLGLDVDGPANDKGLYALVQVGIRHVRFSFGRVDFEVRANRPVKVKIASGETREFGAGVARGGGAL